MPKPVKDELKDDFIKRCNKDESLVSKYPDEKERFSVCKRIWDDNVNSEKQTIKTLAILEESVKNFKSGSAKMPIIKRQVDIKQLSDDIKIIMSREVIDRDGEIISIDGIDLTNYMSNPVLLDSHRMYDSVISSVVGSMTNVSKVESDGIKELVGSPVFASTTAGKEAEILVREGHVKAVSIGFGVRDYNSTDKTITESELYEVSLVSVPSNPEALIQKSINQESEKKLKHLDEIKPILKEYRRFFMSKELAGKLKYDKVGDEYIDILNIYELISKQLHKETPKVIESEPQKELSRSQLVSYFRDILKTGI